MFEVLPAVNDLEEAYNIKFDNGLELKCLASDLEVVE